MSGQKVAKVTISLSQELVGLADRLARERSTSRSGVVAELLLKEEEARIQALMEEGYREMAEENERLAGEALPLTNEMLRNRTCWDERAVD
ncbi:MAG: CopG family transcriptional regulator / antitoxin EndoAI [Dehalococcoidia bacterium]|nr:CopG family transcriptional regulator / antitoxin EndoAI [Dehalococcoidia bacterium]